MLYASGKHGTPQWNPKPEPGVDASKRDGDPLWDYHRGLRNDSGFRFGSGRPGAYEIKEKPSAYKLFITPQINPGEYGQYSYMEQMYGEKGDPDLTHTAPPGFKVNSRFQEGMRRHDRPEDREIHEALAKWGWADGRESGHLALNHAATLPAVREYWRRRGGPGWNAVFPLQDLEYWSRAGDPYGLLAASIHSGNRHAIPSLVKLLRQRDNPAGWWPGWTALHRELERRVGDLPPEEVLRRVTAIGGETRHASQDAEQHGQLLQHAIDGFTRGGRDLSGFAVLADHMDENGLGNYAHLMRTELANAMPQFRGVPKGNRRVT